MRVEWVLSAVVSLSFAGASLVASADSGDPVETGEYPENASSSAPQYVVRNTEALANRISSFETRDGIDIATIGVATLPSNLKVSTFESIYKPIANFRPKDEFETTFSYRDSRRLELGDAWFLIRASEGYQRSLTYDADTKRVTWGELSACGIYVPGMIHAVKDKFESFSVGQNAFGRKVQVSNWIGTVDYFRGIRRFSPMTMEIESARRTKKDWELIWLVKVDFSASQDVISHDAQIDDPKSCQYRSRELGIEDVMAVLIERKSRKLLACATSL